MAKKPNPPLYLTVLALVVWVSIVMGGWTMLSQYENTPGRAQPAPARWP